MNKERRADNEAWNLIRYKVISHASIFMIMLKNYFNIALRNFRKHKTFTLINLLGLSVGMACSLLIFLWIDDELQFNRFHTYSEQIFKIMQNRMNEDGSIHTWGNTPYVLGDALTEEYPSILQSVKVTDEEDLSISVDDVSLKERSIFATPNLFEVFSFSLIAGDSTSVLSEASSIVISESLSHKLFGEESALGKMIHLNAGDLIPFTVTGIFEDIPHHSTLQFDMVLPMQAVLPFWNHYESWGNSFISTYVLLDQKAKPAEVEQQIAHVVKEKGGLEHTLFLLSLVNTYRYTTFENGKATGGRIDSLRLFSIIAIMVLLIACINFVNLTTARATRRAREVGVRKVAGASKSMLVRQFLSESILLSMAALLIAVLLMVFILPNFNQLTGKQIHPDYFHSYFIVGLLGIGLLTGILSGIYPAFFLSSFHAVNVLKGTFTQRSGTTAVRRSLVVFQFAISTLLIAGTLAVFFQMEYVRHKNLGLDKENIIYVEMDMGANLQAYKNDLLQEPSIQYFTAANGSFRWGFGATSVDWKGRNENQQIYIPQIAVDYNFIEAFGIRLKEGRSFAPDYADTIAYILNEEAVKVMGFENPIGEEITMNRERGPVVGVAENFHFTSLHKNIEPLIIQLDPRKPGVLYFKTHIDKTEEALAAFRRVHQKYSSYPLHYHFLNDTLEAMYSSEMLMGKLSRIFAGMAIFISSLGLLGLAIFTSEQRTKEIGIRKVLGASVSSILFLLSKDYIKLILIACLVAIPIANYFITDWLQGFAYRIEVSWWLFAAPALLICVIALLSVSGQTMKAARQNPVDSLRYE
ncbi:ABC transporter permease [Catalinimonas niigatensis]|uniref:ABC transporter permease n=1 Tax=Catalinimonas niigatensis TaxID=1397264 RepID=UPI00266572C4|nr:ABC transporter permease [Catalinimonas niigatensis]WPP53284.1 ABC transporter permease [Catalinimonas niigatensis]